MKRSLVLVALLASACATTKVPSHADRAPLLAPALAKLGSSDFEGADAEAKRALVAMPAHPEAHAIVALVRWLGAVRAFGLDMRTIAGGIALGVFNERVAREAFDRALVALGEIEAELAQAEAIDFGLELSPARLEVDWDGDGQISDGDRRLLEVEVDQTGAAIPQDDPRRRPTFAFDAGDVPWARAMVAFQSSTLAFVAAYDWSTLVSAAHRRRMPEQILIRVQSPELLDRARTRLLAGLGHAGRARSAYLAETDDDREWLPNPGQKDHPLPMPIDERLYTTWAEVLSDVEKLVESKEALSIADLRGLDGEHVDGDSGYLDVGVWLRPHPERLIDLEHLDDKSAEGLARIFGTAYVKEAQRSRLPERLLRMKGELDRGEATFTSKLRYLLWLN